jgi:hypothetical protein
MQEVNNEFFQLAHLSAVLLSRRQVKSDESLPSQLGSPFLFCTVLYTPEYYIQSSIIVDTYPISVSYIHPYVAPTEQLILLFAAGCFHFIVD